MKDRGLEMISLLNDFDVGRNHITWVGHSKGGLFIKQILIHGKYFIITTIIEYYSALDEYLDNNIL